MTTLPLSTRQQRQLLADVQQLIGDGARTEREIEAEYASSKAAAQSQYETARQQLVDRDGREIEALEAEYLENLTQARCWYETELQGLQEERDRQLQEASQKHETALLMAEELKRDAQERASAAYDADQQATVQGFRKFKINCRDYQAQLHGLTAQARDVLRRRGCQLDLEQTRDQQDGKTSATLLQQYADAASAGRTELAQLANWRLAQFLDQSWWVLLAIGTFFALLYPLWRVFQWPPARLLGSSAGLALAIATLVHGLCYQVARRRYRRQAAGLSDSLAAAQTALAAAQKTRKSEAKGHLTVQRRRRDKLRQQASAAHAESKTRSTAEHDWNLKLIQRWFTAQSRLLERTWEERTKPIRDKYEPLIEQRKQDYQRALAELESEHAARQAEIRQNYQSQSDQLLSRWQAGLSQFADAVDQMNRFCHDRFPAWEPTDWSAHPCENHDLPALRFGQFDVGLDHYTVARDAPADSRLTTDRTHFTLPAVLSFPECPSLLIKAHGEGRQQGILAIQNVMLRFLTALPPGKVRFTIIDPTGLGQNFSAFMHLTDYDERLVTNRIWTEVNHINQRLADLTRHMEDVIQTYLRNEFDSIQDYNAYAGEVAEPFRILVVANFPANFSEEAARRLVSIASSGARCGVFTLISTDTNMALPRNFDVADLEVCANTLDWQGDRFQWQQDQLQHFPLELDLPPASEVVNTALHAVGQLAKDANRVEVAFTCAAPEADQRWTRDSRQEIEVPLGRAGATKLQSLRLGRGTSQHVLVAGKTGSGKSTLLHALITNVALYYSPHEVQFYLVDFKKGVEFKPYAECRLPHARVIAIESEREFGMSVLERLDVELRKRGDLFRAAGVQNVAGYRDQNPEQVMPRLVLVIDEFQEFFVKEDKIAMDASLLLDRLVRQGRAFGIHVLLGSQTLAGAYSLARSTIGQMAVRIALQCSESDAHLILSEDNSAARLLSRPGEAIYNDANGLFEGNHPFQIVWLPDQEREQYLTQVRQLAEARGLHLEAPLVFEGNVAADPSDNPLLRKALESPTPRETPLAPRAWLGAPIAIKDPTAAIFRRQSGSNLLIVGHNEEAALGILANALISLAAFSPQGSDAQQRTARMHVLDGSGPDAQTGSWQKVANSVPVPVQITSPRGAADVLAEVAGQIDARLAASDDTAPPVFLIIHNLSRFRDLRKGDDDFGFGSTDADKSASPNQLLGRILGEGPTLGLHTLFWCDTYTNLNRFLDRQNLHDIDMRVLFQMSATDSSNLMDAPEASRLGLHRAVFYRDEQGLFEKFRPYGPPTPQWLQWTAQQFQAHQGEAKQPEDGVSEPPNRME